MDRKKGRAYGMVVLVGILLVLLGLAGIVLLRAEWTIGAVVLVFGIFVALFFHVEGKQP